MPHPSKQTRRADLICDALRTAILERALMPGMKLPEDSLGERFGTSRTIIHQALERLASEGLVALRKNRGAMVAQPNLEEGRDLFELRAQVEDLVISRLAAGLTTAQETALENHIAREEAVREGNPATSIRLGTEFHILMAELTGSPVLLRYVKEIGYRCGLTLSQFARPHLTDCGIQEHRAILAALKSGDSKAARRVARQHLEHVSARAYLGGGTALSHSALDALSPYAEAIRQKS